jgi:hypothetical protein
MVTLCTLYRCGCGVVYREKDWFKHIRTNAHKEWEYTTGTINWEPPHLEEKMYSQLIRLEMHNVMSHKYFTFRLHNNAVLLQGGNGAGKTAALIGLKLFDIAYHTCWGKTNEEENYHWRSADVDVCRLFAIPSLQYLWYWRCFKTNCAARDYVISRQIQIYRLI